MKANYNTREIPDNQCNAIINSINEGVVTIDLNWKITSFNRAAERITGINFQEALGRHCYDVFHADICEHACPLRKTLETKKPVTNATACIISGEGEKIPVQLSTAIMQNSSGNIIGGVETFRDLSGIESLRKELESRYSFEDIIGRSRPMQKLFDLLPLVAASDSTVLIEGPSGTGKELFARAIHNLSSRKKQPFVAVNCGALPDSLLESELFGYKAGAFTDARHDKAGRFALADGGTIFLDEIGDVSLAMQVRLLRVLQEKTFEPLGSTRSVKVNVRIISATNRTLSEMVRTVQFREDLYYRIRVVHLQLPPLTERREDIPLLTSHLISKFNHLQGRDIEGVSSSVLAILMKHDFPGNVRELENIIEQAFVLCQGNLILPAHLPPELRPEKDSGNDSGFYSPATLAQMESVMIREALKRHGGNRRLAAQDLGIDPSTLYRKIKSLNLIL